MKCIFTRKQLGWSLFLNKVAGYLFCNFLKKETQHRYFVWTLQNFYKNLFLRASANRCFWTWGKSLKNTWKINLFFYNFFISLFFTKNELRHIYNIKILDVFKIQCIVFGQLWKFTPLGTLWSPVCLCCFYQNTFTFLR